jgi:predicted RNA-binding Zn-ribbon protein involved in translation (DUF1610 family)
MVVRPDLKNEPYCGNCGYRLTGATESSKCPECGRPLVEVLTRNAQMRMTGKRYRSKARLFGLPVIDVALGPANGELRGKARGIIAIGDIAVGGIALGGVSIGVVPVGGVALGLCSFGGSSIGLLTALGGLAVGGMAVGGAAFGVLAVGGGAFGVFAQGAGAQGMFTRQPRMRRPAAGPDPFEAVSWFFGSGLNSPQGMILPVMIVLGITLAVAALIGLVAWWAVGRTAGGMENERGRFNGEGNPQ